LKNIIAIPLIIAAFLFGVIITQSNINPKIEDINQKADEYLENTRELALKLESQRAIDNLDATVKIISLVVQLEKSGGPKKYIAEEYIKTIKSGISRLKTNQQDFTNGNGDPKVDKLLEKANTLVRDIEFHYM